MDKFASSRFIFVCGIGGSDLASKAVWNAMTLHRPTDKKLFFLEAPDSLEYAEVQDFVNNQITNADDIVLIAASKSGKTAETLETFHKTFEMLSEKFGAPINERVLIISTPDSPLWQLAAAKNFEKIEWPPEIGGRFSAFSTPHTAILKIAGLDVNKFREGSHSVPLSGTTRDEPAELAQKIFENKTEILDFFIFNSELEDLGKWCRQLIAESLAVLTPTVSLGPTDLHSMLELYLEKPEGRFTIFVRSKKEIDGSVNEGAHENVTAEFQKRGLPHFKYEMAEINEYELGKFMAFMISVTLELAKLLGVDPYDQPAVDAYKDSLHNS
jgi:glucose-6-phosphate isomerase